MLVEEEVDRFRRGAMAARRLKSKRLEDRACCRAEVVVLDMFLALGPCGAHQDVVARAVLQYGRLASERVAVLEVLVGSSQRVGGGDVDMPVLGGRVVDSRDARDEEDSQLVSLFGVYQTP